jgi:hypothetical protein
MRWLIIALMLINGVQLVLLQATINATISLQWSQTWTYVALSFVALLVSAALIAYGFARGKGPEAGIRVKEPSAGGDGTVSSDESPR